MRSTARFVVGVSLLLFCANASAQRIVYPPRVGPQPMPSAGFAQEKPFMAPARNKSGKWRDLDGRLPFTNGPALQLLLTDGSVIVDDFCTPHWYRLTPDRKGRYENGTWSTISPMPGGYQPLYFASEVLPDGRLIINGGEYNGDANDSCGGTVYTRNGALYDPSSDTWTSVAPPSGWAQIGDAPSVVLPDGNYMLASCCSEQQAIAAISGTTVTWNATGKGKRELNSEEGWTQLPDGDILVVDANRHLGGNPNKVEIYDPSSGRWSTTGKTAQQLVFEYEIGPAVLRPDRNVIYFGAAGHNDIYDTSSKVWSPGPDFPQIQGQQYDCADAPAALLPSGNVIVQASPRVFELPSHFFEFAMSPKGSATLTQVDDSAQASGTSSWEGVFLNLPTGQVLWNNSQTVPIEVATYTPKGTPQKDWLPVVASVSDSLERGSAGNPISGTNFNGFSQGSTYGDDAQMSTNWPIVRITNNGSGNVCYARSHDFSTMGVWTTGTTNAQFDIPRACEKGASSLQVVVNGLASTGVSVTLN